MKACTLLLAAIAVLSFDSALGMKKYLEQLPNGEIFEMDVAHITTDKLNDFGKAFSAAGSAWSTKFCQSTFPGTTMTVGQAFGDPCCTWKVGEDAVKTVNAFAGVPTTTTQCDSAPAPGAETPAAAPAAATTPAPAAAPTVAPAAATTPAPAVAPLTAVTPAPAAADKATPAPPAGKTPNLRPVSKCGVKSDAGPTQRESKSLDDESEEIDY